MTTPAHRASKALAFLSETDPALSVLALWCAHRDGEGTTETQGHIIRYGATFPDLSLAEQVGTVAHHVLHVALQHSERRASVQERLGDRFDPSLFGVAADGIVNETLLLAGHAIPRPAVRLTELLDQIGQPAPGPVAALSEWDTERLAMYLHADTQRRKQASEYAQQKSFTEDVKPSGAAQPEGERSASDWRQHMVRALEAGRRAGIGIGRLGAVLADLAPPRVPWEVQLRGALVKAVTQESWPTHRRPASRWAAMLEDARRHQRPIPAFQPGRARDRLRPRIVVGLDTSSSIEDGVLSLFLSEIQGVSRRTGAETHVLAFDDEVHFTAVIGDGTDGLQPSQLRIGGGTDFAPLIEAAARLDASVLVVLTDLDGPFGAAPGFPVIWAVPSASYQTPPFGSVLILDA